MVGIGDPLDDERTNSDSLPAYGELPECRSSTLNRAIHSIIIVSCTMRQQSWVDTVT